MQDWHFSIGADNPIFERAETPKDPRFSGVGFLAIIMSSLGQSLTNLQNSSAALALSKFLPARQGSHGLSTALVMARLREAELLVGSYMQSPRGAAVADQDDLLKHWRFHR
jgi:hypothetical protein